MLGNDGRRAKNLSAAYVQAVGEEQRIVSAVRRARGKAQEYGTVWRTTPDKPNASSTGR